MTVVGRGDRAKFWSEFRVDGRSLKEAFPRCFVLAIDKNGTAQDYGFWVDNHKWVWTISTRRPLFDWEKDQWNLFLTFLDCLLMSDLASDAIA